MEGLEASTEEKKKYGPQISGEEVSGSRTKQEPDLQNGVRERNGPGLVRPFRLVKIFN
jgi:hypothetical protein